MDNIVITSITRGLYSIDYDPQAVSHTRNLVTLDLFPHLKHRVVHRNVRGCLYMDLQLHHLGPKRTTHFPAGCLQHPNALRHILSRSLGLAIDDDGSVNDLASELLHCFNSTRSLHLCAEFEVVQTTVVTTQLEEEVEEEEDDEEWLEAMERLKVDCGFDSRGQTELGTCSICLDDLCCQKKLIQAPCLHLYHESCIVSWLEKKKNSCPLCRTQVLL